jgi:hypothetical protein
MVARPHVAEVHDLHVWAITTGMPAASAHVLVEPRQDCHAVRADLEALLARDFGISHLTLQVDHCPDPVLIPVPHDHDHGADSDHDHDQPDGAHSDHDHDPPGDDSHGPHVDHDGHAGAYATHDADGHDGHDGHDGDAHDSQRAHDARTRRQGPHEPPEGAPTAQQTEEDHAPGLPHCEDSHGPAYRPTHNSGS